MKKIRVRVTKEQAHAAAEELKKTSAKRKKTIVPGPWTNTPTKLSLQVSLKEHKPVSKLESYSGVYREDANWSEKAWYPISINLVFPKMQEILQTYGLDQTLAACEKALNEQMVYGDLVLLYLVADNSNRHTPFLSCRAKTNKKNIVGFAAIRNQEMVVIKNNQENHDLTPTHTL
jgi:hypothetical protein